MALEERVAGGGALERGEGSMPRDVRCGKPPLEDESLAVAFAGFDEAVTEAMVAVNNVDQIGDCRGRQATLKFALASGADSVGGNGTAFAESPD